METKGYQKGVNNGQNGATTTKPIFYFEELSQKVIKQTKTNDAQKISVLGHPEPFEGLGPD